MRLFSICETKARILSARFSVGYLRGYSARSGDPKGFPVEAEVEIGAYYEMYKADQCMKVMEHLLGRPIDPPPLDLTAHR